MQLTRLEAAVILGIVIPQISSISISSAPSDCLAAVDTCMSDLCGSQKAFYGGTCHNEGCQIKGSEVCNMTIQDILDQFPSLRWCVCTWEEELCDSIQTLATQCHKKPANREKRSTMMDWKSSSLISYVYDGAGSCLERMTVCVSDTICNKYLAPVLQACRADPCDPDHCQQATQHFYDTMPPSVAEILFMCECEASDQICLQMKSALHSGTCGAETQFCQHTVNQCVDDNNCRNLLKTFQAKCWSSDEAPCSGSDFHSDECFTKMDPALILGGDFGCKVAILATLGTALHHPCSCEGMHSKDLQTCNMIHDVLHNRSHFVTSQESSSGPSKPFENNESTHDRTWPHGYFLYAFAILLFVGVVVIIPLAIVSKIWMLRKKDKTKFHHPQKRSIIL